jgi:hypothetical protein
MRSTALSRAVLGSALLAGVLVASLAACHAPAPEPPSAEVTIPAAPPASASASRAPVASLWLESDSGRLLVALVRGDHVDFAWPGIEMISGRLEADSLRVDNGVASFTVRVDERGRVTTDPPDAVGREPLRLEGEGLTVASARARFTDDGTIAPPLEEGVALRMQGGVELTSKQKWLLVVAQIALLRGYIAVAIVEGLGRAFGCEADPTPGCGRR